MRHEYASAYVPNGTVHMAVNRATWADGAHLIAFISSRPGRFSQLSERQRFGNNRLELLSKTK